ncbi:cyclodeaminase/cyclohydrolase family protein, partial [bacterium]|nr:cyclodeaminase/cyclohydrolase family protein [bacterium]
MKCLIRLSVKDFCQAVASENVTPGGGSVSAMSGAMAASLALMVLRVTIGKAKFSEFDLENISLAQSL